MLLFNLKIKSVWEPGSIQIRWGSLQHTPVRIEERDKKGGEAVEKWQWKGEGRKNFEPPLQNPAYAAAAYYQKLRIWGWLKANPSVLIKQKLSEKWMNFNNFAGFALEIQ